MPGCLFCRVVFVLIIGAAGLVAGAILGPLIAGALGIKVTATITNLSEIIGLLVGLGIGIDELAAYLCCHWANCKEYCPKGSTEFWTAYGSAVQRTKGHLTSGDCKELSAKINDLVFHGQIDDAQAETLRKILAKRCPN